MPRRYSLILSLLAVCLTLCGCAQSLQRGMLDNAYISTSRPSISVKVKGLPLLASGEGFCNMYWTGMLGGLPVQMWIAVYGEGGLAPMAITAQAQVPSNWYWNGIMRRPFSVDQGTAAFNGVTYEAWTYIVDPARDPFGAYAAGVQPDGQPQLWIARAFAARFNFNVDKIILEYREPLPPGITNLTALPLGYGDFLLQFAERARNAFEVGSAPTDTAGLQKSYIQGMQWQYMGQGFLGSVTQNDLWVR